MKTKIYFSGFPKFYINKKKGVVICKATAQVFPAVGNFNFDERFISVCAKAKCKPGERFDLNRGMRIAKTRAENMIYEEVRKKLYSNIAECEKGIQNMKEFIANSYDITAHNNDYVDRLSFEARKDYIKRPEPVKNAIYEITNTKEKTNKK